MGPKCLTLSFILLDLHFVLICDYTLVLPSWIEVYNLCLILQKSTVKRLNFSRDLGQFEKLHSLPPCYLTLLVGLRNGCFAHT